MSPNHNCKCIVIRIVIPQEDEQQRLSREMEGLLQAFPHPRHQPLEAVIALHKVRELRDRIIECPKNQAGHVQSQDVPK